MSNCKKVCHLSFGSVKITHPNGSVKFLESGHFRNICKKPCGGWEIHRPDTGVTTKVCKGGKVEFSKFKINFENIKPIDLSKLKF